MKQLSVARTAAPPTGRHRDSGVPPHDRTGPSARRAAAHSVRSASVAPTSGANRPLRALIGVTAACLAGTVALTGCSGSSGDKPGAKGTDRGSPSPSSTFEATRWWSNAAGAPGSLIDPSDPNAGNGKLSPSKDAYCGMLEQTLAAGKSILPGVAAADPALLTATKAFIGELQKVAPADVQGAWQTLGAAVIAIAESGGDAGKLAKLDAKGVGEAANQVAASAKKDCGLDLSATPSPSK
jgi:hypothetical protein